MKAPRWWIVCHRSATFDYRAEVLWSAFAPVPQHGRSTIFCGWVITTWYGVFIFGWERPKITVRRLLMAGVVVRERGWLYTNAFLQVDLLLTPTLLRLLFSIAIRNETLGVDVVKYVCKVAQFFALQWHLCSVWSCLLSPQTTNAVEN